MRGPARWLEVSLGVRCGPKLRVVRTQVIVGVPVDQLDEPRGLLAVHGHGSQGEEVVERQPRRIPRHAVDTDGHPDEELRGPDADVEVVDFGGRGTLAGPEVELQGPLILLGEPVGAGPEGDLQLLLELDQELFLSCAVHLSLLCQGGLAPLPVVAQGALLVDGMPGEEAADHLLLETTDGRDADGMGVGRLHLLSFQARSGRVN